MWYGKYYLNNIFNQDIKKEWYNQSQIHVEFCNEHDGYQMVGDQDQHIDFEIIIVFNYFKNRFRDTLCTPWLLRYQKLYTAQCIC